MRNDHKGNKRVVKGSVLSRAGCFSPRQPLPLSVTESASLMVFFH